jgi:transcriptional regulator with XRE-family HTH domain
MAETKTKNERTRRKDLARYLFVNETLSQKEIAGKVGVSENTLSNWIKKEKWDLHKSSVTISRQEQLKRIYDQISAINKDIIDTKKGIPTASDADILAKLSVVIRKLENEASIADVVEVAKRLLTWLRPISSAKATEMAHLFDEFINECLKGK